MSKVTIQFADNQSGVNANVEVGTNGHSHELSQLLVGTNVANDGYCNAVQLQANFSGVTCIVKKNDYQVAKCTADGNNYAQFDRTPISELTVGCTRA